MANEKIFQSRIQLKHDTEENWLKATNFIPKEGEIIIYDPDSNNPTPRFKVGNGTTVVGLLSFAAAQADWNITDTNDSGYIKNKLHLVNGSADGSVRGINTKVESEEEGGGFYLIGNSAFAVGNSTEASGDYSHAEGLSTAAIGEASHAEGDSSHAYGHVSHAEGFMTEARGNWSHAEGNQTVAAGQYQHVQGSCNIEDTDGTYAHIVGNGGTDGNAHANSNAHTIDWFGNAWFSGDVYVGSTSGTNRDEGSKKLATEEYVDAHSEDSVKKFFLIIETVQQDSTSYLLDGITFNEIQEKFNTGNVNMVCRVDGTDYIPLLSVTQRSIIFSGIYNTTSVSLVFDTEGIGTLTTSRLAETSALSDLESKSNKVTEISGSSTDTQYPSAKAVKTYIDNLELITVDDIDTICGANIVNGSEVTY